jgi:hypothetical protein
VTAIREPVPDLLRRFAPTPHLANVVIEGFPLAVQTNDLQIITEMQRTCAEEVKSRSDSPLLVRVVRDEDAPADDAEVVVISAWPLLILTVGTGTTIVLDCERREILGFLSLTVSAERFAEELLPTLLKRFCDEAPNQPQGTSEKTV